MVEYWLAGHLKADERPFAEPDGHSGNSRDESLKESMPQSPQFVKLDTSSESEDMSDISDIDEEHAAPKTIDEKAGQIKADDRPLVKQFKPVGQTRQIVEPVES